MESNWYNVLVEIYDSSELIYKYQCHKNGQVNQQFERAWIGMCCVG